ncbi:GntR family transcriptional regulator [Streptosporangium vulgare]|uniref:GntR family transcriptional regulator n=1 Tax=Streptosporangium vulgare TaxID=46190 RepID=UPI0031D1F073
MSSTPRYRAIADDLTHKIRSGHYRAGEALPAQRELSASYGVTMMTLRQALQVLSGEGLIVQRAGRGTYVTPASAEYPLDTLRSLGDDLRRQGYPLRTEGAVGRDPAGPALAHPALLGDAPSDRRALRLARVRHLLGRPAVHQVSWVVEPHASAIRGADFTETPLYTALTDAGARVHRATERIRPALLTAPVAALLRHPAGARSSSANGRPMTTRAPWSSWTTPRSSASGWRSGPSARPRTCRCTGSPSTDRSRSGGRLRTAARAPSPSGRRPALAGAYPDANYETFRRPSNGGGVNLAAWDIRNPRHGQVGTPTSR